VSFFCPRCRTPLPVPDGSALRSPARATCPDCGFAVDLGLADTADGAAKQPLVSLVRDHTGRKLGTVHLESFLGAGGMGSVYRGTDEASGEAVAVKLMYPQLTAHAELVQRFRREAQTLRDLRHPRIVAYRSEGEADGQPYIVMEYVAGDSLEQHLARGPIARDEALAIAEQIGEALGAAHAAGVVHRDLKPANVLLTSDGVKVLDFGIAHVLLDDLTLTRSGAVLGTFNYMAPEQRTGAM
jgi:eukaryotic-like serine/threonine-protein kinase